MNRASRTSTLLAAAIAMAPGNTGAQPLRGLLQPDAVLEELDEAREQIVDGNFKRGAVTQRRLAAEAWNRFLAPNAPRGAELSGLEFLKLVDQVLPSLSPEKKGVLRRSLEARFLKSPAVLRSLPAPELTELLWVTKKAGVPWADRSAAAMRWAGTAADPAAADPGTLAVVLHSIRADSQTMPVVERMTEAAWKSYLGSDAAWEQSASFPDGDRLRLAREASRQLARPQREDLLERITNSMIYRGAAIESRSPEVVRQLLAAGSRLGMSDEEQSAILTGWMSESTTWRSSGPWELQSFVSTLRRTPGNFESAAALREVSDLLYERFLSNREYLAAVPEREVDAQARMVPMALTQDQREGFAVAYQQVLLGRDQEEDPAALDELVILGKLIENAQLERKNPAQEPFAAAVFAALDRGDRLEGHLYWEPLFTGSPLHAEQNRVALEKRLVAPEGLPNLTVGRLLSFAAAQSGEASLRAWQKRLDTEVAEADSGDQRAAWLLLRSFNGSLRGLRWDYLRGREDMEAAISAASSPAGFIPAASWYGWRLSEAGRGLEAATIIEHRLRELDLPASAQKEASEIIESAKGRAEARVRRGPREQEATVLASRIERLGNGDEPLRRHVRETLQNRLNALRSR